MATGRLPDPNTAPVTAKGDLYTYSTVPAKLAVGNNGETLVADSSTSTGLRWQEPKAGNPIINSAFQVWQRGTSFAGADSATNYTADRWVGFRANATFSRQATGDTTNLPNIQYAMRAQRNSGQTFTSQIYLGYSLETVDSIPFAGKTVTLSFYARRGANFSATSNNLETTLGTGTGTDQNFLSGYTGIVNAMNGYQSLTTTWQRFSLTGTIGSTVTEIGLYFRYTPTGTAGTNDWFEVTGVQLEVGSVATPFKTYAATLAGELAAAMRYYQKSYNQGTAPATNTIDGLVGTWSTAVDRMLGIRYPVVMRVAPTVTIYSSNGTSGKVTTFAGVDAGGSVIGDLIGDAGYRSLYTGTNVTASTAYSYHYTLSSEL